ncbi:hypothetical protein XENOCAPTIV_018206 [Xenoophorus captivus]|uniref:Uncharacterized protein n=1 Tax=Xenoophorus captivus TaxID=1517983 RepID=A0ABV0RE07_9TELE
MLQDFRRRIFLQGLLDAVHTAEIFPVRSVGAGGSSGAGVGLPGPGLGINPSTTGSTLQSKPPGGTKNLPITFQVEEEEGTNLPQETNKSQPYKDSTQNGGLCWACRGRCSETPSDSDEGSDIRSAMVGVQEILTDGTPVPSIRQSADKKSLWTVCRLFMSSGGQPGPFIFRDSDPVPYCWI